MKRLMQSRGNVPIVIWTAENVEEQMGMPYFMYLLKEKPNDVLPNKYIVCFSGINYSK